MDIGIIHLTDLHLTDKTEISKKINSLIQAIENEFSIITKRYLVITGDIANQGKSKEYKNAIKILRNIKDKLNITKIILVPGNHDCNFDNDNQIRRNIIKNIGYDSIGDDGSVIEGAIKIQNEFWEFYSEFNELPNNRLAYELVENFDDLRLSFKCFNTAWMYSIKEKVGELFFPVKLVKNQNDNLLIAEDNKNEISISVFHHPVDWFSPNKTINNRNEFQDYLDNISNIKLIGHEHENKSISRTNLDTHINALEFSGDIFNNNENSIQSGFQIFKMTSSENKVIIKRYVWKNGLFVLKDEKEIPLQKMSQRKLRINERLLNDLDDIKIPLVIDGKNVKLSAIYVFPDLELKKEDYRKLDDYIDAQKLLDNKYKTVILYAENQIGKTSLLYMLFKRFYDNGQYPFLLNGIDINNTDIDKIVKRKFNEIYDYDREFDRYLQIEKVKKVLLIDDLHRNKLSLTQLKQFIIEITNKYEIVIITVDSATEFSADKHVIFNKYNKLEIKPLGYEKTDDLVSNYFRCKSDFLSLDEQEKLTKIKLMFNQVKNLLGDKILPYYPIFIISILRTLDDATYNLKETSYGYCYESLLYFAFKSEVKLAENELTYYLSFIEQLAFRLFSDKKKEFGEDYFKIFYNEYEREHIIDDYSDLKNNLVKSHILKEYDDTFKFGYKYIFYFLVAKHIAGIIDTDSGKIIIKNLFENLHIEENANILVFITHHTKNTNFIEESVLRAMEPFEKIQPITLEKNCSYYSLISGLVENIKKEIIKANVDPVTYRKNNLREIDNNKDIKFDYENNKCIEPYVKAFKSIDIVSQIIKNRLGYLKKDEIRTYIVELYLTAFRMIGAISKTYNEVKDKIINDITDILLNDTEKKAKGRNYLLQNEIDRNRIEKEVNRFLEIISLQLCLGIFSKLAVSVGIKDKKMKDIYTQVASEINSPAAKLVSFSIKSYYYNMTTEEVRELAKEFQKNPVAFKILKSRVISYVYNNHLSFRKKQQLSEILNLELRKIPKSLNR